MKIHLVGIALFCSVSLVASVGLADNTRKAKAAFNKGASLFEAEKFDEAAVEFRKAYEIKPNWKLLYNIGQCEAAARHYDIALELFETYLVEGGDNIDVERTQDLLIEIDRLKKLVGYVEITGAPQSAEVTVNGRLRGQTPLIGKLAVTATIENNIAVQKDGETLFEQSLRVHSGQTEVIDLAQEGKNNAIVSGQPEVSSNDGETATTDEVIPPKNNEEQPKPAFSPKRRYRPMKTVGWSLVGTGAGALIAASITGSMALSKNKDLQPECKGGCPDDLLDDEKTLNNLGLITDVLIVTGATLATTGLVLLMVARNKEKKDRHDVSILPNWQGNGMGLVATGAF
ncbi:MAG: tetratricopeptide repeat protein [Deltaproteobacteria bacterium]|nr:tetratricopeptide repeat protein [Deltaproteobacteria bacterium]